MTVRIGPGLGLVVGVCAVASGGLFARQGLQGGTAVLTLALWRLTFATLVMGAWGFTRKDRSALSLKDHVRLAIAGICLALHFLTWFTSLEYVSVARSTLMVSTTPIWAGLLGWLFPSLKPAKTFWWGLALSSIGILLVTNTTAAPAHPLRTPAWAGDLTAVMGAIFVLPYLLISQHIQTRADTRQVVTEIYAWAALALWLAVIPAHQPALPANGAGWIGALGMALVPQMVGHTSLNRALRHFSAAQVSTAVLLEPVFAGALAWAIFGEALTGPQCLGAAILLTGVGVALRKKSEPPIEAG